MRIFGLEIKLAPKKVETEATPVRSSWRARKYFDWFTGAWQQEAPYDCDDGRKPAPWFNSVAFGCMRLLSTDIAKLPPRVVVRGDNGITSPSKQHPWTKLLRTPNSFQTWPEFILCWILSKLVAGNTYVLKLRDARGMVGELIVLNPFRVQPLVSASTGNVYYQFIGQSLEGLGDTEQVVVAATEIIHDKHLTLFHPLLGVAPLVVASLSASAGRRILRSYDQLYAAGAVPPGVLTIPDGDDEENIALLAQKWEEFRRAGKTAILEEGMKYEAIQAKAVDQQALGLVEWTAKDICIAFGVPPWKLGLEVMPISGNAEIAQQSYYEGSLQWLIEMVEWHIGIGLGMGNDTDLELDVRALYRMDTNARYTSYANGIKGSFLKPNEVRAWENLPPVEGGDEIYMQQQNYGLKYLEERGKDGLAQSNGAASQSQPGNGTGTGEDAGTTAGTPGAPTEDGDPQAASALGTRYRGVYDHNTKYKAGDFVTRQGSLWHCEHDSFMLAPGSTTKGDPAETALIRQNWKLAVKGK